MESTIISIPCQSESAPKEVSCLKSLVSHTKSFTKHMDKYNNRRVIHSIKVGTVLLIASLINLLDPLYKQVGQNAVWAIATVVITHEFSAGATLSKGLNRIMGTIVGGGLGILLTLIAQKVGGVGNCIIIGTSVFIFGAAATYTRMIPTIKKTFDYGVMILVLTFNLVVLSGLHCEKVIELASARLSTIGIGIGICFFTSLIISPVWAGEDLHCALASELDTLAHCIEGFFEEYFQQSNEKEHQCGAIIDHCKEVLYAKSKDESLASFAKWEPWHGKFGPSYPWNKYLQIGDDVRELAAVILSLKGCLQCPRETSSVLQQSFKEPCETFAYSIAWTLQELAESIRKMKKCLPLSLINPKLKTRRLELNFVMSSKSSLLQDSDKLEIVSLVFLLMTMMEKAETLVKDVEELGELANFHPR